MSRAKRTTLNARGPDITRNIARPVSVFINLKADREGEEENVMNNLFQSIF